MQKTQTDAYPYPFITDEMISREADRLAREVCNRRPHSAAEDEDDEHMDLARDGARVGLLAGFADMASGREQSEEPTENRYWPQGWAKGYARACTMVALWCYNDLLNACKATRSHAEGKNAGDWLAMIDAAIAKAKGQA